MRKMVGTDITVWRKERKMTQGTLAQRLNVTRKTINRWEAGESRLPADLGDRLQHIAITTDPKPYELLPTIITPLTCPRLYARDRPDRWAKRGIHPASLADTGFLDPAVLDGAVKTEHSWQHVPFAVLEDPRYLDAMARWNASGRRVG